MNMIRTLHTKNGFPGLCVLVTVAMLFSGNRAAAQSAVHPQSQEYQWPDDPLVRRKLDQWQNLKFGMIIHWGLYAVPGIVESWSICSEDWVSRDSTKSYEEYKKWYWGLQKDFNPVKFDPAQWAEAGRRAGMKYLVFTTKHHDGFCMFDTKETSFKISAGPFAANPKADVAKWVFDAFRQKGFMIGAYFSKPDWHSENYWWPTYATPDRNNNYSIKKYPWRWEAFKKYTYNQLSELMHNYGSVDILWLDGGWVRPRSTINAEVLSWGAPIPAWSQDIDMPKIATMARSAQPGLLMVDRTVHGPYENYQTPEQRVPDRQLEYPWESCMTLGSNWGYVPGEPFKTPAKVIHTLIEVVAKGGSLLLGIGPKPDGTLPEEVIRTMSGIGQWMDLNGEAIYNTRTVKDYHQDSTFFTQNQQNGYRYALVCLKENQPVPATVNWQNNFPRSGTSMKLLQTGTTVAWKKEGNKITVTLPAAYLKKQEHTPPALAFSFVPENGL